MCSPTAWQQQPSGGPSECPRTSGRREPRSGCPHPSRVAGTARCLGTPSREGLGALVHACTWERWVGEEGVVLRPI